LFFVAVAGIAGWWWRHPSPEKRIYARLPATPDLTGKPAVLIDRLAKAHMPARSLAAALDKTAELGRLYHANGFYAEAAVCWHLLQTEQPRNARWDYYLADLERTASNYPAMSTLLMRTTELAPDYAPAWLVLAGLQFKTGQMENARRAYQQRLRLLPDDPYARLGLVRIALQEGRQTEARTMIEQLVKDAPRFSSAHNLYAEILSSAGDAAGAKRERWLGQDSGRFREADDPWLNELHDWCYDVDRLCAMGAVELQTGYTDRAKSYYERVIQLKPGAVTGYELLSGLYLKFKEPAKARDMLEKSLPRLKNSKPSLAYYINLCQAYQDLKQEAEMVRVAREGLQKIGANVELYSFLGTALGDLGRPDEALSAFQQALALNPNATNPNFNKGLVLLKLGRRDEAFAAFKKSLVQQPTFPDALVQLGQMEMEAGHAEAAKAYLQPLMEFHPDILSNSHWHAGQAAEAKKDFAAAERHYREGVSLDPNHADLQASLGVLYLVQGRFADALAPLETYHRLEPQNPQSCMFLAQTYAATGRTKEARLLLTEGVALAEKAGNTETANNCREMLQGLQEMRDSTGRAN
jgi:HemY protein